MLYSYNARGRALKVEYADGTSEEFEYSCCGLIREVDRDGIENHHTYDALRRRTSTTRSGITTETAYDAEGNVLKTKRIGSDSSEITVAENSYDLAGRLVSVKNALNEVTNFSEGYTRTGHDKTLGQHKVSQCEEECVLRAKRPVS